MPRHIKTTFQETHGGCPHNFISITKAGYSKYCIWLSNASSYSFIFISFCINLRDKCFFWALKWNLLSVEMFSAFRGFLVLTLFPLMWSVVHKKNWILNISGALNGDLFESIFVLLERKKSRFLLWFQETMVPRYLSLRQYLLCAIKFGVDCSNSLTYWMILCL